jgi:hypothetical protein
LLLIARCCVIIDVLFASCQPPAASHYLPWPFAAPVASWFLPVHPLRLSSSAFFSKLLSSVAYFVAAIIFASSAATMFAPWVATSRCCCMMATKDDDGVTTHIIQAVAMMPLWRFPNQATEDTNVTG